VTDAREVVLWLLCVLAAVVGETLARLGLVDD
jgi:hypothetical protein